jgi:hypothetical protein
MTGPREFPTTCAVHSLSVGEIIVGDNALLEQLDGTCDVNRTAVVICGCARVSSCYAGCVLTDAGRNATASLVSLKSVSSEDSALQHSIRPLAVRHGV